jgi:hypothetical protein
VKPAVPPPRTDEQQQRQQQAGPAAAITHAATSPSSEPDDEPSESKGSNHAALAPVQPQLATVAAAMPLDCMVAGATAVPDADYPGRSVQRKSPVQAAETPSLVSA